VLKAARLSGSLPLDASRRLGAQLSLALRARHTALFARTERAPATR
jgi:hypothetical protein